MNRKNHIGTLIKEERQRKGYTQIELARLVNERYGSHIVDARTISRWEVSHNAVPSANKITKVLSALISCNDDLERRIDQSTISNMHILSWNVNRFNGVSKVLRTNPDFKTIRKNNMKKISEIVKMYLMKNESGIVVLQEVPSNKLNEILNDFGDFKVHMPVFFPVDRCRSYTVAITNRNSGWSVVSKIESIFNNTVDYLNRIVEIRCGELKLFGVHLNNDDELWDRLIRIADRDNTVIIGDYNAHTHEHRRSSKRRKFHELMEKGLCDLIDNDYCTYFPGNSTIDHVLVSRDIVEQDIESRVIPYRFSDHAAIQIDSLEDIDV